MESQPGLGPIMKVVAREYESNRVVRADCDEDWAQVWRPRGEPRPVLLSCGEGSCHVRLCAVQKRRKSDGQITRWFAFTKGDSCDHNEVDAPVVVLQPVVSPATVAKPSGETAEHLWLKDYVDQTALDSGYEAVVQEQPLPRLRIVPDVTLGDAVAGGRVEVQRGATDVPSRTEKDADVVWLLRLGENFGNDKHLFDWPCVSVRITAWERGKTTSEKGRRVTVKPWETGSAVTSFRVEAMGTVLRRRNDPDLDSVYGFFETRPMSLDQFLTHVWAGKRRWHPRHGVHRFGGWALESDLHAYQVWLVERRAVLAERAAMVTQEQARRAPGSEEALAVAGHVG